MSMLRIDIDLDIPCSEVETDHENYPALATQLAGHSTASTFLQKVLASTVVKILERAGHYSREEAAHYIEMIDEEPMDYLEKMV